MKSLRTLRLLDAASEPPAVVKERVRQRVAASLAIAAALSANGAAAAAGAPLARVGRGVLFASRAKLITAAVGLWLSGVAVGAFSYSAWHSGSTPLAPSAHVVASVSPGEAPSALALGVAPASAVATPESELPRAPAKQAPRQVASASSVAAPSTLARERELLDRARFALAHADGAAALAEASNHERAFPHGALREERQALQVRALFALGQRDEARERARAFQAEFPNSFLSPALESALTAP
jgi:hypothetical protein